MMYLFLSRMALYFTALSIVFFHAGIAVPYDLAGIVLYFFLVPAHMICAALSSFPLRKNLSLLPLKKTFPLTMVLLLVVTLFMSGMGASPLKYAAFALAAYLLTLGIFRFKWFSLSAIELLFTGGIYVRLINFTRGSEQLSGLTGGFIKTLFFIAIGALTVHALILYRAAASHPSHSHAHDPDGLASRKDRRDYLFLALLLLPVLIVLAIMVPRDAIEHSMVFNQLFDKARPDPKRIDGEGNEGLDGSLDGNSDLNGQRSRNGEPGLSGIPSDQWNEGRQGTTGDSKQYTVMVVASKQDPVYLADSYYDGFDPVSGFMKKEGNYLNNLPYLRFIETWENPDNPDDMRRIDTTVSVFSTLRERVLAYHPRTISPLVYNVRYRPFNYSCESVSEISVSNSQDWETAEELSPDLKDSLSGYLDIPLSAETEAEFRTYLDGLLSGDENPGQRILAILTGFSGHQYEAGFNEDDTSTQAIRDFLFRTKTGDCTEFSNAAAILGRLAGIPSRVVTGFLASSGLQTLSHLYGLYNLRESLTPLQQFPINELFLVTTAHKHSWPQFYLSGYGWIDFESTDYAIPPVPGGNANDMEVVIPLITEQTVHGETFSIPWRLIAEALILLIFLGITTLYLARAALVISLKMKSSQPTGQGVRAVFRLLLVRLSTEDFPVIKRSQTAAEYAEMCPDIDGLRHFADTYYALRFNPEIRDKMNEFREFRSMGKILAGKAMKKGLKAAVKRILSLKALRYL